MCWDPICTVAEVWCCSEHYLWLFGGGLYLDPFTAVYCCRAVVSEDAKATWASALQTLSLEGGSYSVSRCVRTWIKFTLEYPFNTTIISSQISGQIYYCITIHYFVKVTLLWGNIGAIAVKFFFIHLQIWIYFCCAILAQDFVVLTGISRFAYCCSYLWQHDECLIETMHNLFLIL